MAKLNLSVAVGPYDRTRALIDGTVQIDGVKSACMTLSPEEIFFRAFRQAEFDICELSLSDDLTVKTAQGNCPYVGVPAFVSRAFRHTSIYVRTDRIKKPGDLKGKKVGLPEYQLTANVWARATLMMITALNPPTSIGCAAALRMKTVRKRSASSCRPTFTLRMRRGKIDFDPAEGRRDRWLYRPRPRILAERHPKRRAGFSRTRLPPLRIISSARASSDRCIGSACDALLQRPKTTPGSRGRCSRPSSWPRRWRSNN